jgi:hypothetical protein
MSMGLVLGVWRVDHMDVGGRATHGCQSRELRTRPWMVVGRVMHGAITE